MNRAADEPRNMLIGFDAASIAEGEAMALNLFHTASQKIPAYKDFLKKHNVDARAIKTYQDFSRYVPVTTKKNYVQRYSLTDLSFEGNIFANQMISSSSGSSGVPTFWPRSESQDNEGAVMFGDIYDSVFGLTKKSALIIVCFSMGTWIAGTFTTMSTLAYARQGRNVHVITPGLEKEDAVRAIKGLSHNYDTTVLVGYPPFVKDTVDECTRLGVDWKALNVKLLLASESFSEEWRDYLLELINEDDPLHDTSSIYGSADMGIIGVETPLTIALRRKADKDFGLRKELFQTEHLPSLVQYDPRRRHIEVANGGLLFTVNAGIPLIRYDLQDEGGIISHKTAAAYVSEENIKTDEWNRPLVYVHGRKLFNVTIYGVNVYPEIIKSALLQPSVQSYVTGKFTMSTKNHSDMDQYFEINIELAKGEELNDARTVLLNEAIKEALLAKSSEYHKLHATMGDKVLPVVKVLTFADPDYFPTGAKHKWVKEV